MMVRQLVQCLAMLMLFVIFIFKYEFKCFQKMFMKILSKKTESHAHCC